MASENKNAAPTEEPREHANRSAILRGLELVTDLAALREKRLGGEDTARLSKQLDKWFKDREKWHKSMVKAEAGGAWMPLLILERRLGLSPREVDILLIALAPTIDPEVKDQVQAQRPSLLFQGLDVDLILSLLFHSREERFLGRDLLSPASKLVRNGLIQLQPLGNEFQPDAMIVRASETLANFVLQRPLLSGSMAKFCSLIQPDHLWDNIILPMEQKELIWEMVSGEASLQQNLHEWGYDRVMPRGKGVVLLFSGPPGTGKTAFSHAIAQRLGRMVLTVHTSKLLGTRDPLEPILSEIFRVASLSEGVVLIDDCEPLLAQRDARFLALLESLERNDGLLVMTTNNAPQIDFAMARRILYRLDFESPVATDRELIWEVHLPPEAPLSSDIDVHTLANTYEFTGAKIRNTVLIALVRLSARGAETLSMDDLRDAAETQLGAKFDDLAVKSDNKIGLDRLVLPEKEMKKINEVLAACRHREYVLNRWGFGKRLPTGRGICILFDGPPGTGKTFTAEILATELRLPLYRVHIPNVVSKWVGETERNIAEIFVRARAARAMLLFDEADSLFGRRSTSASSANDRYANMEVNLLLQEIERYDGITVLTTNLFGNLDEALQRRIQFRVTFPFPEAEERGNIWKILTPPEAPLDESVNFMQLGKEYELAGGHIKNALLRAAYRARDEGGAIAQNHLIDAAMAECQAQGKIVRTIVPKKTAPRLVPASDEKKDEKRK